MVKGSERQEIFILLKQVIFEERRKGIVSRESFEWNKNDSYKEFKATKKTEFVDT